MPEESLGPFALFILDFNFQFNHLNVYSVS